MPEIDLGSSVDGYGLARVFAVMLFPKDTSKRDEFLAFARAQAPLEPLSPDGEVAPFYQVLNHARADFLKRVRRGSLSGEVLRTLLQIHAHHRKERPDEPSINKAIAVFARRAVLAQSGLESAWGDFRPVAHLWAALVIHYKYAIPPGPHPSDNEGLLRFLAVAESIRLDAEKLTTRGRSAVLRPAETWKVPPRIALEEVKIQVSPLTAVELKELRSYRASQRR